MPPVEKKGMSTGCIVSLVIGLVVAFGLCVIGVLMALGLLGGRLYMSMGRQIMAQASMMNLKTAIESYQTEYSRLPIESDNPTAPPASDRDFIDTSEAAGRELLDALVGSATSTKLNPRQIRFWEPLPSPGVGAGYTPTTGLIDPWGKVGFRIHLDDNHDGHIADPEKVLGDISGSVLIYSAGPDGDFLTWKDNVCSWKN